MYAALLIHNHSIYRTAIKLLLSYELSMRVIEAKDTRTARVHLRSEPIGVLIIDSNIPAKDIQHLLRHSSEHHPQIPAVLLATRKNAVLEASARQLGAHIIAHDCTTEEALDFFDTIAYKAISSTKQR